jgi:hypothetical protein
MKRVIRIPMGDLAEPDKHPLTCRLYRETLEWLTRG